MLMYGLSQNLRLKNKSSLIIQFNNYILLIQSTCEVASRIIHKNVFLTGVKSSSWACHVNLSHMLCKKLVFDYINETNLDWFSTPSHWTDVELLEGLNVGAYKLGSDDATISCEHVNPN